MAQSRFFEGLLRCHQRLCRLESQANLLSIWSLRLESRKWLKFTQKKDPKRRCECTRLIHSTYGICHFYSFGWSFTRHWQWKVSQTSHYTCQNKVITCFIFRFNFEKLTYVYSKTLFLWALEVVVIKGLVWFLHVGD